MRKYTEIEAPRNLEPGTKCYSHGGCQILVSPPYGKEGWHLSISHKKRYPSWDEIRDAWYELIPNAEEKDAIMYLPKKCDYVNLCYTCFHVYEKPN